MDDILIDLGICGTEDHETIVQWSDFQKIDIEKIRSLLNELNMHDTHLIDTEESKFEYINLILMLKYEKFIDYIKEIDNIPSKGFRLENIP